jgi:hypothetical protein
LAKSVFNDEDQWGKIRALMLEELVVNKDYYLKFAPVTMEETLSNTTARVQNFSASIGEDYFLNVWTMGDIVANALRRPIFYYEAEFPISFFPSKYPPNQNTPNFLCLVRKKFLSHFICFDIQSNLYPIPLYGSYWNQFCERSARDWPNPWSDHLSLSHQLNSLSPKGPKNKPFPHPDIYLLSCHTLPPVQISSDSEAISSSEEEEGSSSDEEDIFANITLPPDNSSDDPDYIAD